MNHQNPRVSIGLPVHNGENYIAQAIESVLTQTFRDWELIISDNASSDRTMSICREFAHKDNRIRLYQNKRNLGASPNYNRVFQLSRGQYFAWLAHDDLLGAEFIESCIEELEKDDQIALAFPLIVHVDGRGHPLRRQSSDLSILGATAASRVKQLMKLETHTRDIFWSQFGLIRRNVLEGTCLMDSYAGSDQVLLFEIALRGKLKQVSRELFLRREHPAASTIRTGWTAKERATFHYADDDRSFVFPYCRMLKEHLISTWNSSIPLSNKIQCAAATLYRFSREWKYFVEEMIEAVREVLRPKKQAESTCAERFRKTRSFRSGN